MTQDMKRKLDFLIKDMIENTDYKGKWGLNDIPTPEFDFLKDGYKSKRRTINRENPRLLKIAGFLLAILMVSTILTIATNNEFVTAGKFTLKNLIFNVKNGLFTSDLHLSSTSSDKELLIENEEQLPIGKDYLKELKIPGYVPEGYTFSSLKIANNQNNEYIVIYYYIKSENDILMIKQAKLMDYNNILSIDDVVDEFFIGDARVFFSSSIISEYNSIDVFTDTEIITVSGKLDLSEIIDIFSQLEEE